jgi:hypothetical protein
MGQGHSCLSIGKMLLIDIQKMSLFGLKTSKDGKDWERESISGNEKKVYEVFQKTFMEMSVRCVEPLININLI